MLYALIQALLFTFVLHAGPVEYLPLGQMSTQVNWGENEFHEEVLLGKVSFRPNAHTPYCSSIRFIQAARVRFQDGRDLQWEMGEAPRNRMRTDSGFFIDHSAFQCEGNKNCSPYYRDSWPNPNESQDGFNTVGPVEASLFDAPFGWSIFDSIELEACAYCLNGRERSSLGCAHWGGRWGQTGDKVLLPVRYEPGPSSHFLDALRRFEAFYRR